MILHLYKQMGCWCLEDQHFKTMLGDRLRYRLTDGKWIPEYWCSIRWLNESQRAALSRITGDDNMPQRIKRQRVRDFLERQP